MRRARFQERLGELEDRGRERGFKVGQSGQAKPRGWTGKHCLHNKDHIFVIRAGHLPLFFVASYFLEETWEEQEIRSETSQHLQEGEPLAYLAEEDVSKDN